MGKHSEWRKLAKKTRRKRIRQKFAQIRDQLKEEEQKKKEQEPWYQQWLAEQQKAEELQTQKDAELAAEFELKWQKIELEAQKQFKELQLKLAAARAERAKQNERIKLEWEKEQQKLNEKRDKEEKELQEKLRKQEELVQLVDNFLTNGGITPEHLKTISETNPNRELCPFFKKTSTCRFFDVCSRNHVRPGISKILLIPNFYSHYSLEKTETDHCSDSNLEFENSEMYAHYVDFFYDIIPEFEKCGRIRVLKTCSNHEAHLRGNVYVEYLTKREALLSYRSLNGRWYGGKQISVQFCNIPSWSGAICGLNFRKRCPKGSACNFLHVFRNPVNLYDKHEDVDLRRHVESYGNLRNCRWSESPERIPVSKNIQENRISRYKSEDHTDNYDRRKRNKHKQDRESRHDSRKHRRNGCRSRSRSRSSSRQKLHSRSKSSSRKRER